MRVKSKSERLTDILFEFKAGKRDAYRSVLMILRITKGKVLARGRYNKNRRLFFAAPECEAKWCKGEGAVPVEIVERVK